jgi:hypothetical protein
MCTHGKDDGEATAAALDVIRPRSSVVQCASPSASHLPNEHGDAQPLEEPDKSLGDYSLIECFYENAVDSSRTPLPSMKTSQNDFTKLISPRQSRIIKPHMV